MSERVCRRHRGTPAAEKRCGGSGGNEHCGYWGTREQGPSAVSGEPASALEPQARRA